MAIKKKSIVLVAVFQGGSEGAGPSGKIAIGPGAISMAWLGGGREGRSADCCRRSSSWGRGGRGN